MAESCRERREETPSVGVILFTVDNDSKGGIPTVFRIIAFSLFLAMILVRLWCAFTTSSMAIGYASSEKPKPKAVILRHPNPHAHEGGGKAQIYVTSLSI